MKTTAQIHTTNNTTQEIEIATKVKAIFKADWTHIYIGKMTTQFVINWDKSGMKTLTSFMMKDLEEIVGRKFNTLGIHNSKCISIVFYGELK